MKWFAGSINEAVATSKSRKAVFVVFVEGKDDTSAQFARTIDATEISSRLEEDHFVAIRLESGSEAYRFFAQIYHLIPIPSLFFIGENGLPLEIVAGATTIDDLVSKIDSVLIKAGKSNKHSSSANLIDIEQKVAAISSNNNDAVEAATSNINDVKHDPNTNLISSESATADIINKNEVIEDPIKATEPPSSAEIKDNNEPPKENAETQQNSETKQEAQSKELTAEEKLERARQLIDVQRKQRLEEEQKKEREREIERRKMGRDVQKMRQMQQELEIKQAYEERMREKAAETEAREKVRQQIAQDKLERKQKELALQQQQIPQQQEQPRCPVPNNATVTRIQFRLPSGNSHMGQFEPSSILRDLRTYVIENIDLPFQQFSMSTSFPRRELTNEDNDKTLLELELVPTAVILILPLRNSNVTKTITSSTQDVGFLSRFMWPLLTPIIGVYNFVFAIAGYLFGTNRNTRRQRDDYDNDVTETTGNADRAASPNPQNVAQSSGLFRRYLGNHGGTTIRAQGNIHRLHSRRDGDDENNTWNGNSTQQM